MAMCTPQLSLMAPASVSRGRDIDHIALIEFTSQVSPLLIVAPAAGGEQDLTAQVFVPVCYAIRL